MNTAPTKDGDDHPTLNDLFETYTPKCGHCGHEKFVVVDFRFKRRWCKLLQCVKCLAKGKSTIGDCNPVDLNVPGTDHTIASLTKKPTSALQQQVGGSHYKDCAIQPIEYCQRNELRACETLAIRYITRHRRKHGRQDIEKAIHCLQLLLELDYPQ